MKHNYIFTLLLALLPLLPVHAKKDSNTISDAQTWGLQGNVKSITFYTTNIKGEDKVEKDKLIIRSHFLRNGNWTNDVCYDGTLQQFYDEQGIPFYNSEGERSFITMDNGGAYISTAKTQHISYYRFNLFGSGEYTTTAKQSQPSGGYKEISLQKDSIGKVIEKREIIMDETGNLREDSYCVLLNGQIIKTTCRYSSLGYLSSLWIEDGKGNRIATILYDYDFRGNIIKIREYSGNDHKLIRAEIREIKYYY